LHSLRRVFVKFLPGIDALVAIAEPVAIRLAAEKIGKKAVLFVMVDDTRNCDEVGA
jgi:hypothetical protein